MKLKRWVGFLLGILLLLMYVFAFLAEVIPPVYRIGNNAVFVREAARAVTREKAAADLFTGGFGIYEPDAGSTLTPHFAIARFSAEQDKDDPSLVHYSCLIPPASIRGYDLAHGRFYYTGDTTLSWYEAEGTVRVVTDENGKRQIDISNMDNVFALYAVLRYASPALLSLHGIQDSGNKAQNAAAYINMACRFYALALGVSSGEFLETTVTPELTALKQGILSSSSYIKQYRVVRAHFASGNGGGKLLLKNIAFYFFLPILTLVLLANNWPDNPIGKIWRKDGDWRKQTDIVRGLEYKKYRKQLNRIAATHPNAHVRNSAIIRLKYTEDKETLLQAAKTDTDGYCRASALMKLPYPGEKELLLHAAEKDKDPGCREAAVSTLPYPEKREFLKKIALADSDSGVRRQAFSKLRYPEDRDVILKVVLGDEDRYIRENALKMLRYPEDRGTLRKIALEDEYWKNRCLAIDRLTYEKDKDTILTASEKDPSSDVRLSAAEKLPEGDQPDPLVFAALNEKDGAKRRAAIEKLNYPGHRETLLMVLRADTAEENRQAAFRLLPYPEEREFFAGLALNAEDHAMRLAALERLCYPEDRDTLVKVALSPVDDDQNIPPEKVRAQRDCRKAALHKLPMLQETGTYTALFNESWTALEGEDTLRAIISAALCPEKAEPDQERLCTRIQWGLSGTEEQITEAGWSAAALGCILCKKMKPSDLDANQKGFSAAIEKHNRIIEEIRPLQEKLKPYTGMNIFDLPEEAGAAYEKISGLKRELERGIGCFMLDNGDEPFYYLIHLLQDQQTRVPRFIKQGVIMGLVDWLGQNARDEKVRPLLETVLRVRADIIRSDNELSFFEVRAPGVCSEEEYAALLDDVLHCANPSLKYCPAKDILAVAKQEVPGCMDMLRACPLRIIDPVNDRTLGFYQFKPYVHAMWIQYRPPKDTGEVIARYHEVDDRTKPLSSGLNLKLFLDPWAVIPTLFHENEHFKGDPNEASVFLKTQLFSIAFYKKYPRANAAADVVFARMTEELGLPPRPEKREALNALIRGSYGEQRPRAEAEKMADGEITRLNSMITIANASATWCPQVTFPLFNDKGDFKNRDLIRDILIRFATVPKSVTAKEFDDILKRA